MRHSLLLAALALAPTLSPAASAAQPPPDGEQVRAVVYPFEGARRYARRARDVVESAIADSVTLVTADEVRNAVRDFEIDLAREEAPLELATAVAAPLVLLGAVEGPTARQRTVLRAVDANGEELARRETEGPRTPAGQEALAAAAQELVVEATAALATRRAAQAEAAREQQMEQARTVELDQELLDEVAPQEDEAEDDGNRGVPRYPLVQVTAGIVFRNRNVTVGRAPPASSPGASIVDATYEIGLFPELALRLEARPLVRSGPIPGGLLAWLDAAIGFAVRSETEPPDPQELDTTVYRLEGGVGYLYPIGIFQVGVNAALGIDAFQLEPNEVLPTANYGYLRLGLDGRMWLADGALEPRVFFGYRVVVATNDDLVDTFGAESTFGGLDVGAGVTGVLFGGLTYRVELAYVRWNLSFEGEPANAAAPRGTDGSDDGIRLALQAGWSF